MKKVVKTLLVCGFASALAVITASAQPYIVTLDEQGLLDVRDASDVPPSVVFSGGALTSIAVDPASGVEGLHYEFGPLLDSLVVGLTSTPGDIVLYDGANPSDIIRVFNGFGSRGVFFFSLAGEGDDSAAQAADVDPDAFAAVLATVGAYGSVVSFQEGVDGAGNRGKFGYQPTSGPGTIAIAPGAVIYNFISDPAVPEPGTFALFGVAGGMLALFWRQRSGRA